MNQVISNLLEISHVCYHDCVTNYNDAVDFLCSKQREIRALCLAIVREWRDFLSNASFGH